MDKLKYLGNKNHGKRKVQGSIKSEIKYYGNKSGF